MKLSKNTIEALKNLATINTSILIKPTEGEGTVIRSMSQESNLVGIFNVEENFESELPIYNLTQFLAVLTSMDSPSLEIKDNHVEITSGNYSSKIYFADKAMIKTVREGGKLPTPVVSFLLSNDDLQTIIKMSAVLRVENIIVIAGNGKIRISATDKKSDTSSNFDLVVDDAYTGPDYTFYINKDLLKFIPDDYTVNIAAEKLSAFVSQDGSRTYYVALETPDPRK